MSAIGDLKKFFMLCVVLAAGACGPQKSVQAQGAAQIESFEECVAAGNLVQKTHPARCLTEDGRVFVQIRRAHPGPQEHGRQEEMPQVSPLCEDKCGDNQCQEIVCLGTGCPCAESAAKCPQDCQGLEKPRAGIH